MQNPFHNPQFRARVQTGINAQHPDGGISYEAILYPLHTWQPEEAR